MSLSDGLGIILDPTRKKVTDDPGNITPITISAVSVSGTGGGSATIAWTTSAASSSLVRYGVAPNMDQVTAEADTSAGVTSHSMALSGLTVGKTYLFQVQSRYTTGKDGMNRSVMDGYIFTANGTFVA